MFFFSFGMIISYFNLKQKIYITLKGLFVSKMWCFVTSDLKSHKPQKRKVNKCSEAFKQLLATF